jgi:Rps23 Pro-64 3,4-dihydroxylase Tpa1-like proline 4-hydroxylase
MYVHKKMLEPEQVVGGTIAIFQNVWENIDETIEKIEEIANNELEATKFVPALTFADKDNIQSLRTNYHMGLSDAAYLDEDARKINNNFFDIINASVYWYKKNFDMDDDEFFHSEPYNILKYSGGQHYKAHFDGGTKSKRSISIILYLNDDYTGGELEFVNFGIKIKPERGMLVVFPSNYAYRHIAHPVDSGTKYAIVTWLHDWQ